MSSEWSASQRYRVTPAPGGLGLVQDFLNTAGIAGYGPDLLADPELAGSWAAAAVRTWAGLRGLEVQPPDLDEADLVRLRSLRATIGSLVDHGSSSRATAAVSGSVSASFGLTDSGEVRLEPSGSGWRWLASALWSEILLGQHTGTWRRVKRCHNHDCASTFYDRSKNNSGVWHDVKTCGNVANLRASRARKRQRERAGEPGRATTGAE